MLKIGEVFGGEQLLTEITGSDVVAFVVRRIASGNELVIINDSIGNRVELTWEEFTALHANMDSIKEWHEGVVK